MQVVLQGKVSHRFSKVCFDVLTVFTFHSVLSINSQYRIRIVSIFLDIKRFPTLSNKVFNLKVSESVVGFSLKLRIRLRFKMIRPRFSTDSLSRAKCGCALCQSR